MEESQSPQLTSSRAPCDVSGSVEVLKTWPEGIQAFQGLQFLDMTCDTRWVLDP